MNKSTTPPAITEGVTFLEAIFPPGSMVNIRPIETWKSGTRNPRTSRVDYEGVQHVLLGIKNGDGQFHHSSDWLKGRLQRVVDRAARERTNVFFGTCSRAGSGGKYDRAWQIREVALLWADIDDTHDLAELKKRIKSAGLPGPSIINDSGHGFHVFWILGVPYRIDDCGDPPPVQREWVEKAGKKTKLEYYIDAEGERHNLTRKADDPPLSDKAQHICDILQGVAASIGGDHVFDLARSLRVPGTLNRKNERNGTEPVPCKMVEFNPELKYPVEIFEQFAERSPAKAQREKIAKVKLPKSRKLTPKREDGLNDRILLCDTAPQGERSEVDFSLLCWAIEQGVDKQDLWARVQGVGKFADRGQGYFDATWQKAAGHTREKTWAKMHRKRTKGQAKAETSSGDIGKTEITNGVEIGFGEDREFIPFPMAEVHQTINNATGGWPKRVGGNLFVDDGGVCWLDRSAALFGWLSRKHGVIQWHRRHGCVNRDELYAELQRTAEHFDAIEYLPHEPAIPSHYYACNTPPATDGKSLEQLLEFFSLETPLDRSLLLGAIATPLWGGPTGRRPAFLLTAKAGRGVGKSTAAQTIGQLYDGIVDFSLQSKADDIKKRLLSQEGLRKRICLLDNVKTLKFSSAEFESLITCDQISGHQMYAGEGSRPNFLTWFITLNGASLSTDMAQRVVEVRFTKPTYSGNWESDIRGFIDENRSKILGDLIGLLRSDPADMGTYSRWASWDQGVLARLPDARECLDLIQERRGEVDAEKEEGGLIEDAFASKLRWLGYDIERDDVFIPTDKVARWYNAATGEAKKSVGVTTTLKQLRDEGKLWRLVYCRSGSSKQRGFRWIGEHATEDRPTQWDLSQRLAQKAKQQNAEDRGDGEADFWQV